MTHGDEEQTAKRNTNIRNFIQRAKMKSNAKACNDLAPTREKNVKVRFKCRSAVARCKKCNLSHDKYVHWHFTIELWRVYALMRQLFCIALLFLQHFVHTFAFALCTWTDLYCHSHELSRLFFNKKEGRQRPVDFYWSFIGADRQLVIVMLWRVKI